ncbi:MAG: DUF58 domain-containing protein [Candidatus Cloacimonetes bacterium]|nr:DUF58 domain-containing protein [Candidatus Cloacimonadota bacterium]
MVGLHKSPYHGFSVEFSDHRQYNPGDSIRHLDWKLFAKTERYYIKRFEEETNLKCHIVVDHSASMGYDSHGVSKLEYAKALASALAWLMVGQQDAIGLLTFTDHVTSYMPPRALRTYLNEVFKELFALRPADRTRTASVLHSLAERIRKRGLVILVSDLLDEPDEIISGLSHFRHAGHEVIVFHLRDPQELAFDFPRDTEFEDAETGERLTVSPWQIRADYKAAFAEAETTLRDRCRERLIDYNAINTQTPFEDCLLHYLVKRGRLG